MLPDARIFILSMDRSAQRLTETMRHLRDHGVKPEPFYGFDSRISGLETTLDCPPDQSIDNYRMNSDHVNMNLSHLMLWKTCHYQPQDVFVVLEDDVRLQSGWQSHLADAAAHLPADWDLLFIGSCCCDGRDKKEPVYGRLHRVRFALCTHAYAVRKKALPTLIYKCETIDTHIDINMAARAMPHLSCFAILPRVADQNQMPIPA